VLCGVCCLLFVVCCFVVLLSLLLLLLVLNTNISIYIYCCWTGYPSTYRFPTRKPYIPSKVTIIALRSRETSERVLVQLPLLGGETCSPNVTFYDVSASGCHNCLIFPMYFANSHSGLAKHCCHHRF
jgi:hypothetical protein